MICRQMNGKQDKCAYYNAKIKQVRMYGKLNERKLNQSDYAMSCEKVREELSEYINEQARRVNIDSAKKRAVVQHMDYEGFRQMVLGANIFPTKSKELYSFTKGESASIPTNLKEQHNPNKDKQPKKQQEQILLDRVTGKSELHCYSFRQFKKKLGENYAHDLDDAQAQRCYNLVKQQSQERLGKIFNPECEPGILLKICRVFDHVISKMTAAENQAVHAQAQFMLMFFKRVLSISTMSLGILSKKQKQALGDFMSRLKQQLKDGESGAEIDKIEQIFLK